MGNKQNILVSIVGPTAVGKTSFGIELAKHFNTDIISVDSRQFYKEMEIGTAKPTTIEREKAKHYFVDSLSIHDEYNVGDFEKDSLSLLDQLYTKHDIVVAVGGSGLFYKAIWEGFDVMPEIGKGIRETLNHVYQKEGLQPLLDELQATDLTYFNQVDQQNWQRVIRALEVIRSSGKPFSSFRIQNKSQNRNFRNFKIGLELERSVLFERIDLRMDDMITNGLFEEAEKFYPLRSLNPLQTVGYTEVFNYLDGKYDKQEAIRLLKRNSRRYAKRQMTWFKKDPHIIWHSPNDLQLVIESIEKELQN